jgi:hypothetical protein
MNHKENKTQQTPWFFCRISTGILINLINTTRNVLIRFKNSTL